MICFVRSRFNENELQGLWIRGFGSVVSYAWVQAVLWAMQLGNLTQPCRESSGYMRSKALRRERRHKTSPTAYAPETRTPDLTKELLVRSRLLSIRESCSSH